jgi:hypothetical protein
VTEHDDALDDDELLEREREEYERQCRVAWQHGYAPLSWEEHRRKVLETRLLEVKEAGNGGMQLRAPRWVGRLRLLVVAIVLVAAAVVATARAASVISETTWGRSALRGDERCRGRV